MKKLLLSCIALCLLYACGSDVSLEGYESTNTGMYYKLLEDKEGTTINEGDLVTYHVAFMKADTVYTSSRERGTPIQLKLQSNNQINYLKEALALMSAGDSMNIAVVSDSIPKEGLPQGVYKTGEIIFMNFKVYDVKTEAEVKAAWEANKSKFVAKEKGIWLHNHTNKEGAKPQLGDMVIYHVDIRKEKAVVASSRAQGRPDNVVLPKDQSKGSSPVLQAIQEMAKGDSMTVAVETDSLPVVPQGFFKGEIMYFDVVLLDYMKEAEVAKRQKEMEAEKQKAVKAYDIRYAKLQNQLTATLKNFKKDKKGDFKQLPSGLKFIVHEEGKGEKITRGMNVFVDYIGYTMDGKEFDASFRRRKPIEFKAGEGFVIAGWDEALLRFPRGSKITLLIPSKLAYGVQGKPPTIPPSASLMFYMEIL